MIDGESQIDENNLFINNFADNLGGAISQTTLSNISILDNLVGFHTNFDQKGLKGIRIVPPPVGIMNIFELKTSWNLLGETIDWVELMTNKSGLISNISTDTFMPLGSKNPQFIQIQLFEKDDNDKLIPTKAYDG